MEDILKKWNSKHKKQYAENKQFLKRLAKKSNREIDALAGDLHEEAFNRIDCIQCANCCKTISPIFKTTDIKRISAHLGMKEAAFINKYLTIDEDDDFVVNALPCPFLGPGNLCSIYEVRPRDCADYPHSQKPGFAGRAALHAKNTVSCPAVFYIVEQMKKQIK
jgi:Fe-S-cluster containining protein